MESRPYGGTQAVSVRKLTGLFARATEIYRDRGLVPLCRTSGQFATRAMAEWSRQHRNRLRYGGITPQPYDLISVDPSEITHLTCPTTYWHYSSIKLSGAYIKGGEWDQTYRDKTVLWRDAEPFSIVHLDNWIHYRSLVEHFTDGVPWEDTEWYQRVAAEGGITDDYYADVDTMEQRLAGTDALYDHVQEHGYKTQAELVGDDEAPFTAKHDPCPEYHEITISIGRDGTLFFEEGRHRLAVVKALGLDRVPVRVLVRHRQWQELRHEVATAADPSELPAAALDQLDHPDMPTVDSRRRNLF